MFPVSRQASTSSDNSGVVFSATTSGSQDDVVSEKSTSSFKEPQSRLSKQATLENTAGLRILIVWCERVEDKQTVPWGE